MSPAAASPPFVPLHRPSVGTLEERYVREALATRALGRDGAFTRRCEAWLGAWGGSSNPLLVQSCTAALELAALLLAVGPGDEVVMPSFTFTSTANAFALRGATPVFVDIRPDTWNLDERLVEAAVTTKTRAIVAVHYAGVGCEMDALVALAAARRIVVVEDAAQGLLATYKGKPLGTMGAFGTLSFHETKVATSGEGGALFCADPVAMERAAVLRDTGTNRRAFLEGRIDRYSWTQVGSSYGPSELVAACLLGQLEQVGAWVAERRRLWRRYHEAFAALEQRERVVRPVVPPHTEHNGHIYALLAPSRPARDAALRALRDRGVGAAFHYVPLHSSDAGRRTGRSVGPLPVTDDVAGRLLRLPLWPEMDEAMRTRVIEAVSDVFDP